MGFEQRSKLVLEQEGEAHEFELVQSPLTIGRGEGCDIVLQDTSVSRCHAELILMDGVWYLVEVTAKNGTYLNGREIKRAPLKPGDKLGFGGVELSFMAESKGSEVLFTESGLDETVMISAISADSADLLGGASPSGLGAGASQETNEWLLSMFHEAAESLLASDDLDEMFEVVLSLAFAHLPAQRACIGLCTGREDEVVIQLARGADPKDEGRITISSTITAKAIRERASVTYRDVEPDVVASESISKLNLTSIMCAPLCVDEEVLGVLYLDTRDADAPFEEDHLKVLTALAALSAVALRQAGMREEVNREQRLRDRLSRYSSHHVVDHLMRSDSESGELVPGMMSEEAVASVLFADLVGFTSISESMSAPEVTQLLNSVFARLTEVVFELGGTVDKFIGDEIMVFFGAPIAQEDHAERAVRCALRIQERLKDLSASSPEGVELAMSIGVNSGPVIVGDIGSPERKDYTVIGDTVNTAKRIETEVAGAGELVIGPETYALIQGSFTCEALEPSLLRGKQQPLQLYRVLPEPSDAERSG
ncbi:MAG: FHA domain-containing protein [Planctomycetes bacterium]|nr:FHA domain-containing protein [Planctomycetota bacterium]